MVGNVATMFSILLPLALYGAGSTTLFQWICHRSNQPPAHDAYDSFHAQQGLFQFRIDRVLHYHWRHRIYWYASSNETTNGYL